MRPSIRAFLIAPLAAPLLYWLGLVVVVLMDPQRHGSPETGGAVLLLVLAVGAPVSYAASLVGLFPALWILSTKTRYAAGLVVLLGASLGGVTAIAVRPGLHGELFTIPLAVWQGAILGGVTAGVFSWLQFRFRDRDARSAPDPERPSPDPSARPS